MMWQHPLPAAAARLWGVPDLLGAVQGAPAGHPRSAHRPDDHGRRRAPVPPGRRAAQARQGGHRHGHRRGLLPGPHAAGHRGRAGRERGGPRLAGRAGGDQGTRGSTWARATASTTTSARGWTIRPSRTRRSSPTSRRSGPARTSRGRPRRSSASATASPPSTRRCSTTTRAPRSTSCWACRAPCSRTSRSTSFYCDYWFLTRWYNKIREFGALLASTASWRTARTCSCSTATRCSRRWRSSSCRGRPVACRRARITGRRSPPAGACCSRKLEGWTPPPALGSMPDAVTDSMVQMLWGVTPARLAEWAAEASSLSRLTGYAGSAGEAEGPARVLTDPKDIGSVRDGEILVCGTTSPAWAPIFPKVLAVGDRHRRRHVARGDRLAGSTGCRRSSAPAAPPRSSRTARSSTSTVSTGVVTIRDAVVAATVSGATASLAQLRSSDEARFGGKSSALGELLAGGIPVPPGFAVSVDAFREHLHAAGLADEIAAALDGLDVDDTDALSAAAVRAGAAVLSAEVPDAIRGEDRRRLRRGCARRRTRRPRGVAVRSSACGEDSADATFAGQQETYLWVRGAERVVAAVRDCWASPLLGGGDRLSRTPGRRPAPSRRWASPSSSWPTPDVAGVMFTCNPVSGDPSVVAVNAAWGLGLGVVGGDVTPDEFLVSKVTREVVRRSVSRKEVEYRPAPGGGTEVVPVEGDSRHHRLPRRRGAAHPSGHGQDRPGPLRLTPGHRVGAGRRRALRPAVAPGDDAGQEARRPPRRLGDGPDHAAVRGARGLEVSELSAEDVREILAIIDAEGPSEVRVTTRGWSIHVVRGAGGGAGGASASAERRPSASGSGPQRFCGRTTGHDLRCVSARR